MLEKEANLELYDLRFEKVRRRCGLENLEHRLI